MRIAVAGSEGFIGQHVCALLTQKGYDIVPIDIINGTDLCHDSIVDEVPAIDSFIHLANLGNVQASYNNPVQYYRANYLATLNALEICRRHQARFIYASSSYVYGIPQYLPIDENHPLCSTNPYAQTKLICERLCQGYNRDFGVKVSILRPFNIYGIGQKGMALIPEIVEQLKEDKQQILLKNPIPKRDYVNVTDAAAAFVRCTQDNNDYCAYNICSGKSISVKQITELINKHLKKKVVFNFQEQGESNPADEIRGCNKKLKKTGWKPIKTFEQGIIEILNAHDL